MKPIVERGKAMKPVRLLGLGVCLALVLAGGRPGRADDKEPVQDGKPLSRWAADLKDPEYAVRARAVAALDKMGPDAKTAVPALLNLWKECRSASATKEDRALGVSAAAAAFHADPDKAGTIADLVVENLREPATADRAAELMKKMGAPAVPALVGLLKDKATRSQAAGILGDMRAAAKEAVPALAEAFADKESNQFLVALALAKLGPDAKAAVPTLLAVLQDKDQTAEARVWAAKVLPGIDPTHTREAVAGLADALKYPNVSDRLEAAGGLGDIGPDAKAAAPALLDALADADHAVRLGAARALRNIDPEQALKAVPALRDEVRMGRDPILRIEAAGVWLQIDAPHATEAALALASDFGGDGLQGAAAAQAWERAGSKVAGAVPGLIDALKDGKASVRRDAARALGMVGADAKEAVPALKALLKDEDKDVRQAAAKALEKIAP